MTIASLLDDALRAAGLPVIGVSIGVEADKATWKVVLEPQATRDELTAAAALVAAFDPTSAATLEASAIRRATADPATVGMVTWVLYRTLGRPPVAQEVTDGLRDLARATEAARPRP